MYHRAWLAPLFTVCRIGNSSPLSYHASASLSGSRLPMQYYDGVSCLGRDPCSSRSNDPFLTQRRARLMLALSSKKCDLYCYRRLQSDYGLHLRGYVTSEASHRLPLAAQCVSIRGSWRPTLQSDYGLQLKGHLACSAHSVSLRGSCSRQILLPL